LGGVAIVSGVLAITYSALIISGNLQFFGLVSSVLLPAVFMGIIGLIDDIKRLAPWPRFFVQNCVGAGVSVILVSTDTLGSPSGNTLIDVLLSVFWIVGITNSINFFDNIDGGASGAIGISTLTLFVLALQSGQLFIAALSVVLAGSTVGFLGWNRPPARIYMGDAGALFLGVLVSTLTLRFDPSPIHKVASFSIPVLLLAVPILDTTTAVLSRIRRGISPFQGGRDHLSHRLMRMHKSKRESILILWILNLFFCIAAVMISYTPFQWELLFTLICALIWLLLLTVFLRQSDT
jgi:UDP-GlcNAc:undecaprenyl-phosphate GlcNAc-1-phosphate transferase